MRPKPRLKENKTTKNQVQQITNAKDRKGDERSRQRSFFDQTNTINSFTVNNFLLRRNLRFSFKKGINVLAKTFQTYFILSKSSGKEF